MRTGKRTRTGESFVEDDARCVSRYLSLSSGLSVVYKLLAVDSVLQLNLFTCKKL